MILEAQPPQCKDYSCVPLSLAFSVNLKGLYFKRLAVPYDICVYVHTYV